VTGAGVVFLHGQPGYGSDWRDVCAQLPPDTAWIAPDRPGYGASQLPAGGFAWNASATLQAMDAAQIDQAVLVGHSFGGGVALAIAEAAPHRIRGIVLLAPVGPDCLNLGDHVLAAPYLGPLLALWAWTLTPWAARLWRIVLQRRAGRDLRSDEAIALDIWGNSRHRNGSMRRTFLVEQRALFSELDALLVAVPEVHAPVLLLADPHDSIVPFATAQALQKLLPDARLAPVAGGHHLPRRRPEMVALAIRQMLGDIG
jgi:pimeloyl-ACP methyl ester carboxylesterase